MDELTAGGIIGGLAALVCVPLILVPLFLLVPRRACPECGALFPKFRMPQTSRQLLWGGGTCEQCGCEVDRKGKKIKS
jgi:hypothetical protein